MRYNVYVDGLNLYKGALSGHPNLKWLDLIKLADAVMVGKTLGKLNYFTSPMKRRFESDQSPENQATYMRVLRDQGINVVTGKTVRYEKWLRHVQRKRSEFVQPELPSHLGLSGLAIKKVWSAARPDSPKSKVELLAEKASDVNLASYLLRDALGRQTDETLVISGDTDLATPIQFSAEAGIRVIVLVPNLAQLSSRLRAVSTDLLALDRELLRTCQLANPYRTKRGSKIYPPVAWGGK